jgi:hypothetical protein
VERRQSDEVPPVYINHGIAWRWLVIRRRIIYSMVMEDCHKSPKAMTALSVTYLDLGFVHVLRLFTSISVYSR